MDLDAKVDLTESRDFSNPYTFNEKVPKPVICWLGDSWYDLDYLRERSKACAENDKRIIRKVTKPEQFTTYNLTSTMRTYRSTSSSISFSQTSPTSDVVIDNGTTTFTLSSNVTYSTTLSNNIVWAVGDSHEPTMVYIKDDYNKTKYNVTYCGNFHTEEDPEVKKRLMAYSVYDDLWGHHGRPFDEVLLSKMKRDSIHYDLFPWESNDVHYSVYREDENNWLPWYASAWKMIQRCAPETIRQHFQNHWNALNYNYAEIETTLDTVNDINHWAYYDEDDPFPWDPGLHTVTDGSHLLKEEPDMENYSERIHDVAPWMVDMLRDTWRSYITEKLVDEYMSAHWYDFTLPAYQEKWFHMEDPDEKTYIQPTTLQSIMARINTITINRSDMEGWV